jgi:Ca2+-binding RTX toxin-like protein
MRLAGGGGNDTFTYNCVATRTSTLTFDGGSGVNTVTSLRGANERRIRAGALVPSLLNYNGESIEMYSIQALNGGPAQDRFVFAPGMNLASVNGGGGIDTLDGGPGDNVVIQSLVAGTFDATPLADQHLLGL